MTVQTALQSPPTGANLTVQPSSLSFSTSDWSTPQTVTVTAEEDTDVEEDAVIELTHTVSGGDYGANNITAASVTVTVPGFEEDADGTVMLRVPMDDPVVTVPEGTSAPAGTRVTLPSGGGTVEITAVTEDDVLPDPPRGFRAGDAAVDIVSDPPLQAGQTAVVCLPASSGSQRVHRYDDSVDPPEWVELEEPPGGSPPGLACGVTDDFSLFALGLAPNETVATAWLARFGRTAAQHVLDGVRERLTAPREPGLRGKLAGLPMGAPDGRRADAGLSPWQTGTGDLFGPAGDGAFGQSGGQAFGDTGFQSISEQELIAGTAFTATGRAHSGTYALWGRGALTGFEGRDGEGSLDGSVTTATFGGDWSNGPWIAGLSLSHSKGRGSYRLDDQEDLIDTSVTGLYPYAGYQLTDRVSVWGVAGYGKGDLTLTPDGGEAIKPDLSLWTAAAGVRRDLLKPAGADGPALALEMDSLFVRTSIAAVSSKAGDLAAVAADASRLRLRLDGSWAMTLGNDARMTPSLAFGVRRDGGDAETGFGLDLGGGVAYTVPAHGVAAELNGRWLLAHQDSQFREWGLSGSLRYDPSPSSERGLSLSVTPSFGASATGGAETLFGQNLPAGPPANGQPGARLKTELGYGFDARGGSAVQIPWAGWSLAESGAQTVRLGWRLRFGPGGSSGDFGIETSRVARPGAAPDHRIVFTLRLPLGARPVSPARERER